MLPSVLPSDRHIAVRRRDRDVHIRREDAECFIEQVRGGDSELASYLRIEERELEAAGLN